MPSLVGREHHLLASRLELREIVDASRGTTIIPWLLFGADCFQQSNRAELSTAR
jgi:hypothetical protein